MSNSDGFTPSGPIHAFGNDGPHLSGHDCNGGAWHIPYVGQTTLDMFERPCFDPRPQFNNIANNNLGYLDATKATKG